MKITLHLRCYYFEDIVTVSVSVLEALSAVITTLSVNGAVIRNSSDQQDQQHQSAVVNVKKTNVNRMNNKDHKNAMKYQVIMFFLSANKSTIFEPKFIH